MVKLAKTKDDAISYLYDKCDEICYKAREASDMGNQDGAKALRLASDSLKACLRYIVDVPYT